MIYRGAAVTENGWAIGLIVLAVSFPVEAGTPRPECPSEGGFVRFVAASGREVERQVVRRSACVAGALSPVYIVHRGSVTVVELTCPSPTETALSLTYPVEGQSMRWAQLGAHKVFNGSVGRLDLRTLSASADLRRAVSVEFSWCGEELEASAPVR